MHIVFGELLFCADLDFSGMLRFLREFVSHIILCYIFANIAYKLLADVFAFAFKLCKLNEPRGKNEQI